MTDSRLLRRASGYLYALPYLLLFALFIVMPLFYGLSLSLFRWEMLSQRPPKFTGISNYITLRKMPIIEPCRQLCSCVRHGSGLDSLPAAASKPPGTDTATAPNRYRRPSPPTTR